MRYNKHELIALASQTSQNFDREGVLVLKERQDSFFRRSEGCSARWFRLRGNLLFYLKGPEAWYEPLGVIVLGNHQVSVQTQDENGHWPFQIVWENGVCFRMATFLESERTLWLKAMETAPYQCLTERIADLTQQLEDTRTLVDLTQYRMTNKIINDFNEVPLCELSLSCDNLLCDANGNPPSPFAVIFVLFVEKGFCVRYSCTEVVEKCSNPSFSRTVMFRGSDGIPSDVMVRIAVYNMREIVSQTGVAMGSVTMRLSHIQEAQRLRVPLLTVEDRTVGFVTINGWSLEPVQSGASPTHPPNPERNSIDLTPKVLCHRRSQSLPPRLGLKLKYPSYSMLIRQNFLNPYQATYRFHSGLGGDITVHEAMAEPRFCLTIPLQLMEIFMTREKELLETMLAFAEVSKRVAPRQVDLVGNHLCVMRLLQAAKLAQQHVSTHLSNMKDMQTAKNRMLQYSVFFKPSAHKVDPLLAYLPANLHLQRMWVHNDTLNKTGFHDVITVGAFTLHSDQQKDKAGGLIKLVQQSKDVTTNKAEMTANTNRLEAEFEKVRSLKRLRNMIATHMDSALLLLKAKKFEATKKPIDEIRKSARSILELWNGVAVEEALTKVGWNKKRIDDDSKETKAAERRVMQTQHSFSPRVAAIATTILGLSVPITPHHTDILATIDAVLSNPNRPTAGAGARNVLSTVPEAGPSSQADAGGEDQAVGGADQAVGGSDQAVGGADQAEGGEDEAVGGADQAIGGADQAFGGADQAVGGEDQAMAVASSSSSSVETSPTAGTASLSVSVPDMQRTSELHFGRDHLEQSPRNSCAICSGKSNRGKQRGKKNNRAPKHERKNKTDSCTCRLARDEADMPAQFERSVSLRVDFKSSTSLEQVSFKSLVSNKKGDKKKARRNRRDRSPMIIEPDPAIRQYNKSFFVVVNKAIENLLLLLLPMLKEVVENETYTAADFEDIRVLMELMVRLLDEMQKWLRMAHTAMRIDTEPPSWSAEYSLLRARRDICFSQALTTVAAGLVCWAASAPGEAVATIVRAGLGPLCGFEGLLSLYSAEKSMWGDMVVAIEDLHTVLFKFVKVNSSTPTIPQVTGSRGALLVEIPVSESLYARFDGQEKPTFTLTAVFFNVGVNEKASVADALGDIRHEHNSNNDNLERLNKYYLKYCKLFPQDPLEPLRASSRNKPLEEVMANLRSAVQRRIQKNVEVIQLAALATRLMHGIRFTSCKSAKDRTGMSVTLEQTTILSNEYHLADHERKRALNIMRSEGCRRVNTLKNIGQSKYAFTKQQVMSLPEDYRPPKGSYGAMET